jgi:hypothetical protein
VYLKLLEIFPVGHNVNFHSDQLNLEAFLQYRPIHPPNISYRKEQDDWSEELEVEVD